ncbi:uncharacterized protein MELLADRAFT_76796 [Melampsora larici-populina 98AG31]|uniref:SET domain-containing protein n=1 Tax=Melampsora larici-populina (strain 98AG31 / pathotype 3-4-7) TaxID=747676 RepID=F4RA40_MELLP|nr:uncharacterized protein MELLADRAFT_76796 [Melampsora larici-populina 98AG31]EGG10415.1 hypothetical protein MELLADRAFT_76796 [Melampsora larici-populina 98AG31]
MKFSDSHLGSWLIQTGNKSHSSLILSEDLQTETTTRSEGKMGWCIYTDESIDPNTSLVSCSIDIAITPRKSRDRISKLLAGLKTSEDPTDVLQRSDIEKSICSLSSENLTSSWSDHQVMCLYLLLTRLTNEAKSCSECLGDNHLRSGKILIPDLMGDLFNVHQQYVALLPSDQALMTPLYWSPTELEKLRYTNLYQATLDRRRDWGVEFDDIMSQIKTFVPELHIYLLGRLAGSDYLWASTIISSRAFPSTLLEPCIRRRDLSTSQVYTEQSFNVHQSMSLDSISQSVPVLLPGVDMLNHQRGVKVEWRSRHQGDPKSCVEIVNLDVIGQGSQVFNNYGAKSTAEWILGYGFALEQKDWDLSKRPQDSPSNPDDFYSLKVAIPQSPDRERQLVMRVLRSLDDSHLFHNLTIKEPVPNALLAQLRLLVSSTPEELDIIEAAFSSVESSNPSTEAGTLLHCMSTRISWENELNALDLFKSMLEIQYERLNAMDWKTDDQHNWKGVREPIKKMIKIYRTGQSDILFDAISALDCRISETMKDAEADGFAFMDDTDNSSETSE